MKLRIKEKIQSRFYKIYHRIKRDDVEKILNQSVKKISGLGQHIPKTLLDSWGNIKLLVELIRDYSSGRYKNLPWKTVASVCAVLAYFVSPIDVIFDFIPLKGYLDDAFAIKLVMDLIEKDLEDYKQWKQQNKSKELSDV